MVYTCQVAFSVFAVVCTMASLRSDFVRFPAHKDASHLLALHRVCSFGISPIR